MITRRYKARKSKYSVACRICLTEDSSQTYIDLYDNLHKEVDGLLVFEALEEVMGEKIMKFIGFPSCICVMCLSFLKVAYNLKEQYYKSKKSLTKSILQHNNGLDFYESQRASLKEEVDKAKATPIDQKKRSNLKQTEGQNKTKIDPVCLTTDDTQELTQDEADKVRHIFDNLGPNVSTLFVYEDNEVNLKSQKLKEKRPLINIVVESDSDSELNNEASNEVDELVKVRVNASLESDNDLELNYDTASEADGVFQENNKNFNIKGNGSNLNNKAAMVEENNDISKKTFVCPYCYHSYSGVDIIQHLKICSKIANNTCYICDKQLGKLNILLKHLQAEHSIGKNLDIPSKKKNIKSPEGPQKYLCNSCGIVKHNLSSYRYHKDKCLKGKPHVCEDCGKTFMYLYILRLHQRRHCKRKEVVDTCPICAKKFHYPNGLRIHMFVHTREYKLQCSICGKKFFQQNALTAHIRTHTGQKPYGCRFCDMKFSQSNYRKQHEQMKHTGERPLECKLCGKRFLKHYNFKVHLCQHEGSFKCDVCEKGFVSEDILTFHLRRKHRIITQITDVKEDNLKNIEEEFEPESTEKFLQEID